MKILLINNFHFRHGGSETVYFNTADVLRQNGHQVIFFSQKREKNIPCAQDKYFPEAIDLNSKGLKKIKGLQHYFYNNDAVKSLDLLLKIEKPDIAHIHLFLGGLSSSILEVLKKNNIPVVNSVHEYRMVCPAYTFKNGSNQVCEKCGNGKFWHCITNRCSKGSLLLSSIMTAEMYYRNLLYHPTKYIDTFIFVSKFCKDIHLKYDKSFSNKNCVVLYNFCNSDVIEDINETIDTYSSYYLYYGRLSFEKGIVTLIEAFSKFPNLQLKIVGTGPEENTLKNKCIKDKLTNIEFCGFKKGKELYDIVQGAKFVCVPSEWYENNPMTIVESYSIQTPVIGAAIGGITEIVIHGKTGFLHKSGSINDLCKMLEISSSLKQDEYKNMKNEAFKFSNKNFNRENYYNQLIDIYQYTINKTKLK